MRDCRFAIIIIREIIVSLFLASGKPRLLGSV
jgi:hypothetical protein